MLQIYGHVAEVTESKLNYALITSIESISRNVVVDDDDEEEEEEGVDSRSRFASVKDKLVISIATSQQNRPFAKNDTKRS